MLNLLCLGKELEVQEMLERLLHNWVGFRSRQGFLAATELFRLRQGFLVATELFWFCVATRVPCVATWFSSFK